MEYTLWHRKRPEASWPRRLIRLAVEMQQVFARAGARVELVATVLDGFIGEGRKHGFSHAPIAQARLNRDLAVQLADAFGSVAATEQSGELRDAVGHSGLVEFE